MSDKEHSESEFYYPNELQFQKNSNSTVLSYNQVGARRDKGNSQTAFNSPDEKLLKLTSNVWPLQENLKPILCYQSWFEIFL